ncbi:hypothetical protein WMY93_032044 [Mugilogobius chulae]|uniref:TRAF3-interacting protein 1 n=1 Tax=Mugilogobius chulae TaxID=88201 RepID=A0AAW0MGJ2_9GOBI
MNPAVVKKTQESLGKVIKKPQLTEKYLSKPPFRYLHDIFTEVIRTTGFMKGLYSDTEMKSENIQDKEAKMLFLQKAVDVVALVSGSALTVRPARVVAGQEPEKTNELLQTMAACCLKKLSSEDAVRRVLSGEKPGSGSNRTQREEKKEEGAEGRSRREKGEEKNGEQRKKERERKERKEERGEERERKERREERGDERERKERRRREEMKERGRRGGRREETRRRGEKGGKRERRAKTKLARPTERKRVTGKRRERNTERERRRRRESGGEERRSRTEDPNPEKKKKLRLRQFEPSEPHSQRRRSSRTLSGLPPPRYGGFFPSPARPYVRAGRGRRSMPLSSHELLGMIADLEGMHQRNRSSSRTMGKEHQEENVTGIFTFKKYCFIKSCSLHTQLSDHQHSHALYTHNCLTTVMTSSAKVSSVILDGKHAEEEENDEDGQFLVQEDQTAAAEAPQTQTVSSEAAADASHGKLSYLVHIHVRFPSLVFSLILCLMCVCAGGLVKKILETKKYYEDSPSAAKAQTSSPLVQKTQQALVQREMERLRSSVQSLCRSALPLGKIMDYIQEDVDSMNAELQQWRSENRRHAQELQEEHRLTQGALLPLQALLQELDSQMQEQQSQICVLRCSVLKNEQKIQRMLTGLQHQH